MAHIINPAITLHSPHTPSPDIWEEFAIKLGGKLGGNGP